MDTKKRFKNLALMLVKIKASKKFSITKIVSNKIKTNKIIDSRFRVEEEVQ